MKYTELYDLDFLNNFNNQQYNGLKNIDLDINNNLEIDIKQIIKACGFFLQEEPVLKNDNLKNKSGYYDSNTRTIYINLDEIIQRRKFTSAHELGHAILNNNQNGILNRFINSDNYFKIEDQINERNVNKFAANLLMPRKLVDLAVNKNRFLIGKELVNKLSNEMNLSKSFVNYRLYNLNYVESLYYK